MREPSIHITEENLHKIMLRVFENLPDFLRVQPEMSEQILMLARRASCDNRTISVTNQKMERKVDKILVSTKGDAMLFANILYSVRKKLRHKGIRKHDQAHRDWTKIKALAKAANDFCNDFELSKREGYIIYITIGVKKISSPRNLADKLLNMFETISLIHEAELEIDNDKHKGETTFIHDDYVNMIAQKTGIWASFVEKPREYVNFIRVREITEKLNIDHRVYLESQFSGLLWTDAYPAPYQLISEKSSERLNRYMFENKLSTKKTQSTKKDFRSILKKIKDVDDRS